MCQSMSHSRIGRSSSSKMMLHWLSVVLFLALVSQRALVLSAGIPDSSRQFGDPGMPYPYPAPDPRPHPGSYGPVGPAVPYPGPSGAVNAAWPQVDLMEVGPFGGKDGELFTDIDDKEAGPVTGVRIWATVHRVVAIQFRYGVHWGPKHGGPGGEPHEAHLKRGEDINSVFGIHGGPSAAESGIFQLGFYTSHGNALGPVGRKPRLTASGEILGGGGYGPISGGRPLCALRYVEGRADDHLQRLWFKFKC